MKRHLLLGAVVLIGLTGYASDLFADEKEALKAFDTVQKVFQSPRCQNCHIPGDSPLQFDAGNPHSMRVVRGMDGKGSAGLPCASCHADSNPPASYGPHTPPGAPHWSLPPAAHKMAWIGLPPDRLCAMIKDRSSNGDRDFAALIKNMSARTNWCSGAGIQVRDGRRCRCPTTSSSPSSNSGRTLEGRVRWRVADQRRVYRESNRV